MTVTQDAPVEQAQYQMPAVEMGQRVLFYRFGDRGKMPYIGFVIGLKKSTITLKTVEGSIHSAVRHMDDPRLRSSEEQQRDLGGWDYTQDDVEDREFKQQVKDRLTQIESQVKGLVAAVAKKDKP